MDRRRWITVLTGTLVLASVTAGSAENFRDTAEIASPRLVSPEKPSRPAIADEPAADSAATSPGELNGPLAAPPADEPPVPPLPENLPPVEYATPTPAVPEIIVESEPSWLNRVVDENLLIWRELPGDLEFIPGDGGSFGLTTLSFDSVIQSETSPGAWLVPKFGWHFLSGPRLPHLPSQMYTLALEFNFVIDVNSDTRLHLHITPTWASDFDAGSESLRMIGGGLLTHDLSSELTLALGAVYLDRPDLPALPLGGIRWRPDDNLEFDLIFPRPRAAWRFEIDDAGTERWFYVGGALGGNSWAFDRFAGPTDRVGYRDLRVTIGVECREMDGSRHVFEAGYVFDRQLDFDRGPGDQSLPGSAVIRIGATF